MPRRFSHKEERGTTVVVVVLVTTLITAIGIFAVRNISQVDLAVGYSRQAGQSLALAELGTTAAVTQIGSDSDYYSGMMSGPELCQANGPYATDKNVSTCHKLNRADLEAGTAVYSGETLLEAAVAGSETGSFGPLANTTGVIEVEMTDKHGTGDIIAGSNDTAVDITLTTMASVSPIVAGSDPCGGGVATMAVKKVMRAHMIVPSHEGTK
jgi:hypothetical protein